MLPADPQSLDPDELAELEFEFLEELMQEPAGGHGHGRSRTSDGDWMPMETGPDDNPSYKRYPMAHILPPGERHGVAAYQKRSCRCEVCKQAWAKYMKERRGSS